MENVGGHVDNSISGHEIAQEKILGQFKVVSEERASPPSRALASPSSTTSRVAMPMMGTHLAARLPARVALAASPSPLVPPATCAHRRDAVDEHLVEQHHCARARQPVRAVAARAALCAARWQTAL